MLTTLKKRILIDETQELNKVKLAYKKRVYWFLGLSWLASFLLIFIIPQNIMTYPLAKSFVNFMGVIVPMVDGLENIRLHGSSDPYQSHLVVLPHISFYYALLWAYAWLCVPYMMWLVKGNFVFNQGNDVLATKTLINRYHKKKLYYYVALFLGIAAVVFIYTISQSGTHWFKVRYVYMLSAGGSSSILTLHAFLIIITFLYTHFLIKQQEKQHAK